MAEREEQLIQKEIEFEKKNKFKEQADRQRKKIKQLKVEKDDEEQPIQAEEPVEMEFEPKQEITRHAIPDNKLTQDNLSKIDSKASEKKLKSVGAKSSKGKPAWAKTEKQLEEEKEREIDDLLEFAYDLDYDKYMEDFEIRQAFEVIKERVNEIKQD